MIRSFSNEIKNFNRGSISLFCTCIIQKYWIHFNSSCLLLQQSLLRTLKIFIAISHLRHYLLHILYNLWFPNPWLRFLVLLFDTHLCVKFIFWISISCTQTDLAMLLQILGKQLYLVIYSRKISYNLNT